MRLIPQLPGIIQNVSPIASDRFGLKGVTVINPMFSRKSEQNIRVSNGRIESICNGEADQTALDYSGYFALPGLVDMHMHLPTRTPLKLTGYFALMFLVHGVTTIRDAGDLDGTSGPAFQHIASQGQIPTPRFFYCGPFVGAGKKTFSNTILINKPKEAYTIAKYVKSLGASFMKIHDGLSVPLIRALEEASTSIGLKTMGHVPREISYEEAKVKETQHFFGVPKPELIHDGSLLSRNISWQSVDEERIKEITEVTLKEEIYNTPTLVTIDSLFSYKNYAEACQKAEGETVPELLYGVAWNPKYGSINTQITPQQIDNILPETLEKKQLLLKSLHDAGATLFIGTDTLQPFVTPGAALQREMKLFTDAGIDTERVWYLATVAAARRLGYEDLGQLKPGALADILLFSEDPSHDLTKLGSLKAVVRDGMLYNIEDLQKSIKGMSQIYKNTIINKIAKYATRRSMTKARMGM